MEPSKGNAGQNKLRQSYEILILILAMVSAVLVVIKAAGKIPLEFLGTYFILDWGIWGVFLVDYLVRMMAAPEKKTFFKANLFDLLAIIPFHPVFRIFRIFRALRIMRVFTFARISAKAKPFLATNGFIYILWITVFIIIFSGWFITRLEPRIETFGDGIWWAFVTVTTVGYGDLSPQTQGGRILASMLMISGIGFISMLTGTIATYFIRFFARKKPGEEVPQKMLEGLTKEQLEKVQDYVDYIRYKK